MTIRKRRQKSRDIAGWVLGSTILVLATLDVFVWATVWNVPNPISKLLVSQSAQAHRAAETSPFR